MLLSLTGCEKLSEPDDELSLEKRPYQGDEFRLDGYYYIQASFNSEFGDAYFFYRDGVCLHIGGWSETLEELDDYVTAVAFESNRYQSRISNWGVFQVEGQTLKFERWYPTSSGGFPAFVNEGTILNDSTFHITNFYNLEGGRRTEVESRDKFYYFRAFSPKPDSTNQFIF